MISLIIWIILVAIVLAIAWGILRMIPMPEPLNWVIPVLFALIALVLVVYVLTDIMPPLGHPLVRWRRKRENALLRWSSVVLLGCLLTLHAPDGTLLLVESGTISALRPISAKHRDHMPAGTHSVIYTGVKTFGISETVEEVILMERCVPPVH